MVGLSSSIDVHLVFDKTAGYHYLYHNEKRAKYINKHRRRAPNLLWGKYGNMYGNNDQVSIYPNLKTRKLGVFLNGLDQGIAYHKIERRDDIYYRIFVSMLNTDSDGGAKIEIVNFQTLR